MAKKQEPGVFRDELLGNKRGKPSTYEGEETCEALMAFFLGILHSIKEPERVETLQGSVNYVQKPVMVPTLAAAARKLGTTVETLHKWAAANPEFDETFKEARDLQTHIMVTMSVMGGYATAPGIFALKNICHWTDRVENTQKGAVNLFFDAQDENA